MTWVQLPRPTQRKGRTGSHRLTLTSAHVPWHMFAHMHYTHKEIKMKNEVTWACGFRGLGPMMVSHHVGRTKQREWVWSGVRTSTLKTCPQCHISPKRPHRLTHPSGDQVFKHWASTDILIQTICNGKTKELINHNWIADSQQKTQVRMKFRFAQEVLRKP